MKRGTPRHRKMYDLAGLIKEPVRSAVGIMEMLWHFAGGNTPEGDIGRVTDLEIAAAVGWEKRPAVLVEALISAKWLDREPKYRLVVHDWPDHCDQAVRKTLLYRGSHFLPIYGPLASPVVIPDSPSISPEKEEEELPPSGTATASAKATEEELKPSSTDKIPTRAREVWFEAFWEKYKLWRSEGKAEAKKIYLRRVLTEETRDKVLAGVIAQTPMMLRRDRDYRPHGSTWLNQTRWDDEIDGPDGGEEKRFMSAKERIMAQV